MLYNDMWSTSSKISTDYMLEVVERLKCSRLRKTTIDNYQKIWRQFNTFLIKLDRIPRSWVQRTAVFCAYLIERGTQSSTIKSYISAIKAILLNIDYEWKEGVILLNSLVHACRLQNDRLCCRLPIQRNLFEQVLFELDRVFDTQLYLNKMYKACFCLAYYGMMRVGELMDGPHAL